MKPLHRWLAAAITALFLAVAMSSTFHTPAFAQDGDGEGDCGDCENREDEYQCGGSTCYHIDHSFPGGVGCGFPWPWQECRTCQQEGGFGQCHTGWEHGNPCGVHGDCGGANFAMDVRKAEQALWREDIVELAQLIRHTEVVSFNGERRALQILSACKRNVVLRHHPLSADFAERLAKLVAHT